MVNVDNLVILAMKPNTSSPTAPKKIPQGIKTASSIKTVIFLEVSIEDFFHFRIIRRFIRVLYAKKKGEGGREMVTALKCKIEYACLLNKSNRCFV